MFEALGSGMQTNNPVEVLATRLAPLASVSLAIGSLGMLLVTALRVVGGF